MSLQPNPSFKDDFDDHFVQVSLEWLWLDRGEKSEGRKKREEAKEGRNQREKETVKD